MIELEGGPFTLEFWVYYASYWLDDYQFKLIILGENDFETLWELQDHGDYLGWEHVTVEIPSKYAYQDIELIWNYEGKDGYSVALDGIKLYSQTSGVEDLPAVPEHYTLTNCPNPFNPVTTVYFDLPEKQQICLSIYNIRGQKIETLLQKEMNAGRHRAIWNALEYPSGLYFIQLSGETICKTQKCMLLK